MSVELEIVPGVARKIRVVLELDDDQAAEFARQLGKISYGSGPAIEIRNAIDSVGVEWEDFDGASRRAAWKAGN